MPRVKRRRGYNKKRMVKEKNCLEGIPEHAKQEIILLYNMGIKYDELEYLIKIKLREALYSEIS